MSSTTASTGAVFSMISPTAAIVSSRPSVILLQREDRRRRGSRRARARSGRPRRAGGLRRRASARRPGSRRASRRTRRRSRPSRLTWSLRRQQQRDGVEVLRRPPRAASRIRSTLGTIALRLGEHVVAAGRRRPAATTSSRTSVDDPPEGHRGLLSATTAALAPMPGSADRMMSNWALIAFTAGSSGRRCSDSTVSSASASVARPCGDVAQAAADLDQRDGEHGDDDDGEQDAQERPCRSPPP